jgi:hypothetical protein
MRGSTIVASSDAAEVAGVKREQHERADAKSEIKDIQHGGLRSEFASENGATGVKSRLGMIEPHIKKT